MLRILADFNDVSLDGKRVRITDGTQPNTQGFLIGQRVIVYEVDDFEVEAILEKDILKDGREIWYAVPDWSTRRDLS